MAKNIILSLCILLTSITQAQQKKNLTLNDLVPGGKTFEQYQPKMPKGCQFWGDQLVCRHGDSIMLINSMDFQKSELLISLSQLNNYLDSSESQLKSLNSLKFPYSGKPILSVSNQSNYYEFNFKTHQVVYKGSIPQQASNTDYSLTSRHTAFTRANNLYISNGDSGGNSELAITNDPNKDIVYGQSVHRNEFGISKGTFWSPTSAYLAFYRMDQTMVTDYPLVDIGTRIATLKKIKYPMAGMPSHQVTVGVFNINTKQTVYLKTGLPKEKYLTNVVWSPDEKSIYIAELNRNQDTCELKRYNAHNGNLEASLFQEVNAHYVEPEHPIEFLPNHPDQFIWQSKRDGYNHLYLYNTDGKQIRQITSGQWDVASFLGFDSDAKHIFILSNELSPTDKQIYRVNIANGKRIRLSSAEGVHRPLVSPSGKYIADTYSSLHNPGKLALINTRTTQSKIIYEANNPYIGCNVPSVTLGSLKANDGKTDLYYRITKPSNFDPNKKYPTIIYVYGGPHSQMVENRWMGALRPWGLYMAEQGYILFSIDNRGTDNRGFDFSSATHRQLGIIETQDQMSGANYLKSLPYVDSTKMGVHGWSYGGFMTLNLMLRHPETFKVGVAGGPVVNWEHYEIMYGERYMDSPQDNPAGYEQTNMTKLAGNLKGRLLIIHGYIDNTVVLQNSLDFLKASIAEGTHPDYFIYPESEHNMRGSKRLHLDEHITRYFNDFLKPDTK